MSTTEPKAPMKPYEKILRFAFGSQPVSSVPRELYATIAEDKPTIASTEDPTMLKIIQTPKGNSVALAFHLAETDSCPILKVSPAIWDAVMRLEDWFQTRSTEYSKLRKLFPQWSAHSFTSRDLNICVLALLQPFDRQVFIQRLKTARIPAPLFHHMLEGDKVKLHWNWMKFATAFREKHQIIFSFGTKGVNGKSFLLPHLFVDEQSEPTFKTNGQSGALIHYSADVCFASVNQRSVAVIDVHSSKAELSGHLLSLILAVGHKFIIHVSSNSFSEGQPKIETDSIFQNVPKEHVLVYWRDWEEDHEHNEAISDYLSEHASSVFKLTQNVVNDLAKVDRDPETLETIDDAREALYNLCNNTPEMRDFWHVHEILQRKVESVADEITIQTASQALEDLHHQLQMILHSSSSNKLPELFPYLVVDQANSMMNIGTKGLTTWDLSDGKVTENIKKQKAQVDDALINKWKALRTGSLSEFMTLFKNTMVKQDIEGILEFNQQIVNAMLPWVQPLVLKRLKLHEVLQLISSVSSNPKEFSDKPALDEHSESAKLMLNMSTADIKKEWDNKSSTPRFWQVMAHLCFTEMKDIDNRLDQENISLELCWRELILYYNIRKPSDSANILKGFMAFLQAGFPLELLNGDTGTIHERPFLSDLLASLGNEEVKVISIFGPQSSGKSTLLNYLFGSQFAVSAGRCTRGMNISYASTSVGKHKGVLVVDTEGFLAVERGDRHFDVQMALLSIACSNTVMINIAKNIDEPMCNILSVAIFCLHRLRINTTHSRPTVKIVLRDVDVTEEEKDASFGIQRQKIMDKLQQIAEIYKETLATLGLGDISVEALPPAFIRKRGNVDFSSKVKTLRSILLKEDSNTSIRRWGDNINAHWSAILDSSLYTNFDSVVDIYERQSMQKEQEKFLEECFGGSFKETAIEKINALFIKAKQVLLHNQAIQVDISALESRLKVKEELAKLMPDQFKIDEFIERMKLSLKTEQNQKMIERNIRANRDDYEAWLWEQWQKKAWDLNQFSMVSKISKEAESQMAAEAKKCQEGDDIDGIFQQQWQKVVEKLIGEVQQKVITINDAQETLRRHWQKYADQNNTNLDCNYGTNVDIFSCHNAYEELIWHPYPTHLVEQFIADKKFGRWNPEAAWKTAWEIVYNWIRVVKQDIMSTVVLEQNYDVASKIIITLNSRLHALQTDLKKKKFDLRVRFETMIHMEFIHHCAAELHKVSQGNATRIIKSFQSQRQQRLNSFRSMVKSLTSKSSLEDYIAEQISSRMRNNFLDSVVPVYDSLLRTALDVKPSELVDLGYKKAFLDGENSNFEEVYEFCCNTTKYLRDIFMTTAKDKELPIWESKCNTSLLKLDVENLTMATKNWGQMMFKCFEKFELNDKLFRSLTKLLSEHLRGKEMSISNLVDEIYTHLEMEKSIDKNEVPIEGELPLLRNISSLAAPHIKSLLSNHFKITGDRINQKSKQQLVKLLMKMQLKEELLELENKRPKQFEEVFADLEYGDAAEIMNVQEFALSIASKINAGNDEELDIRQNKESIIAEAWSKAYGCGAHCPFCRMKCTAQPSNGHQHTCSRHILYCFGGTAIDGLVDGSWIAYPGICSDPKNMTMTWKLRSTSKDEYLIFPEFMKKHYPDWIITPEISNANNVESLITQAKAYFTTGEKFEERWKMTKPREVDYPDWWPSQWRR